MFWRSPLHCEADVAKAWCDCSTPERRREPCWAIWASRRNPKEKGMRQPLSQDRNGAYWTNKKSDTSGILLYFYSDQKCLDPSPIGPKKRGQRGLESLKYAFRRNKSLGGLCNFIPKHWTLRVCKRAWLARWGRFQGFIHRPLSTGGKKGNGTNQPKALTLKKNQTKPTKEGPRQKLTKGQT